MSRLFSPGERVAIILGITVEHIVTFLAVNKAVAGFRESLNTDGNVTRNIVGLGEKPVQVSQ